MLDAAAHKAIFTALTAALSPIKAYDAVPQGAAYPYVVIDSQEQTPDDPLTSRRDERMFYLSIWSQYRGQKEVLDILSLVDSALHQQRLAMDEGRCVRVYVENKRTMREPDNLTFQGAAKVRFILEH